MATVQAIGTCRICGSQQLTPVIDLGAQMLASVTVTRDNEATYPKEAIPLVLVRCDRRKNPDGCGLVQLQHTYPSSVIYREYWYRSGVNQTMRDALHDVVVSAKASQPVAAGDVVLDIGCNDGTLLGNYAGSGLRCFGMDPTENIRGDHESTFTRVVGLFNARDFLTATGGAKARIITSIAMFYDLEEPNQFAQDIAEALADDGLWIVQMADLPEMLRGNMYDQMVHEHLEYYHIRPFQYLLDRFGLKIVDMEKNDVNGGSYRFYVRKMAGHNATPAAQARINAFLAEEVALQLDEEAPYAAFRAGAEQSRRALRDFVRRANAEGKKIFTCGASTKGNVILQYCGLTAQDIPYAVDRNPLKWGGFTVGTNIPIISEEDARALRPDYLLVLPYYFLKELVQRERVLLEQGTKFLVPLPYVHCVDRTALAA